MPGTGAEFFVVDILSDVVGWRVPRWKCLRTRVSYISSVLDIQGQAPESPYESCYR
jgi:hypothetical protein